MTLRPCRCGSTPEYKRETVKGIYTVQLVCKCGKHGAVIMHTKPEDQAKCEQAAADGWNLGE